MTTVLNQGRGLTQGATFSPDQRYRYELWREWGEWLGTGGTFVVIGLNPSTADERNDDPTIRRCIAFAKREGCGRLVMLNLFALRATNPKVMLQHADPVGPQNDDFYHPFTTSPNCIVVAAWGAHGAHRGRGAEVAARIPNLLCFGHTKDGHPKHPLYLRGDTPLVSFNRSGGAREA